jgi:single-strand DNA-binding protein
MAQAFNQLTLVGRVGKDPEIRSLQSGKPVANFSLAVSETWKDKNGERRERTDWVPIVCFNEGLCRVIENYVKKGSLLFVQGRFQTRDWEKDGVKHYRTECVLQGFNATLTMLDSRGSDGGQQESQQSYAAASGGGGAPIDDDIPFNAEWRA